MILFQHSPNVLSCNDQYFLHNHRHKCNYQSQHHMIQCWNNLSSMLKCFDQLHWRNQLEYSYFHMFCKHNLSYAGIHGPKPDQTMAIIFLQSSDRFSSLIPALIRVFIVTVGTFFSSSTVGIWNIAICWSALKHLCSWSGDKFSAVPITGGSAHRPYETNWLIDFWPDLIGWMIMGQVAVFMIYTIILTRDRSTVLSQYLRPAPKIFTRIS